MSTSRKEAREHIRRLTEAFIAQYHFYKTSAYSEAQLRIDFLNPLLKAFGWDVDNVASKSAFLRDVIQEEAIAVEEERDEAGPILTKKNPDYTLRVGGQRKLFIEAKKVSVDVERNPKPAFQTRRYGWNAGLLVSILTNFDKLILYDCRVKPNADDPASIARLLVFSYTDLVEKFDELYDLLSFESVAAGYLEAAYGTVPKLAKPFDMYFLGQIEHWRSLLATDIIAKQELDELTINFLVQRLLNRIIFLRICEDRSIEAYATLQQITDYEQLKALFLKADKRYNAGLFDFIEDELSLRLTIDTSTLVAIFNELYYPLSPYDFSVVDPAILSQIYEQYLGRRIAITGATNRVISIITEAEIAASDGVVPTPKPIVEKIVRETVAPLLAGRTVEEVLQLKVADVCCGSGTFLLSVFDLLLAYITEQLALGLPSNKRAGSEWTVNSSGQGDRISIWGKQQLVSACLYGLDINPYAVEVAKFSLYLKLLEGETAATADDFISRYKNGVLPSLNDNIKFGNALVDDTIFEVLPGLLNDDALFYRIKPFNWFEEFSFLKQTGGFDAIVGNPPYVRIQHMALYAPEELVFYQSAESGYGGTGHESFDKYYLFLQRAITLLHRQGRLGYIIPHKFFTLTGGQVLRRFITEHSSVHKVIHFGVTQVFPGRSTYTAILVLSRQPTQTFTLVKIANLTADLWQEPLAHQYPQEQLLGGRLWTFIAPQTEAVFAKTRAGSVVSLRQVADIPVGLQTSRDDVYIFRPLREDDQYYYFQNKELVWKNDKPSLGSTLIDWKIEKKVCKPCLYDASPHLFQSITPNATIIFPYVLTATGATVLDETTFSAIYPCGWRYLTYYRALLERRSLNGSSPKWYQYGRSQSLNKFHTAPKLMWSVLALRAGYALDEQNTLFTGGGNGPYYALLQNSNYSLYYLLAILSHPIWEAMVKAVASSFRGGYYSHGRQFIEHLPIRAINFSDQSDRALHDSLADLARQVLDTQRIFDQAKAAPQRLMTGRKLKLLIERLHKQVESLYGITDEEVRIVAADELLHSRETDN